MVGFAAAAELHARAAKNGSFVEYVCLGASIVDALLRVGLVLKHQLATRTAEIPLELVLQKTSDKPIREREIYRRARTVGLIDQNIFESLDNLYDDRNRVIHRYIISRITTAEVLDVAMTYETAIGKVVALVYTLENNQIESGVGMTKLGPNCDRAFLEQFADEKHTPKLASRLRGS